LNTERTALGHRSLAISVEEDPFAAVVAAATEARRLNEGLRRIGGRTPQNPVMLALERLRAGLIEFEPAPESAVERPRRRESCPDPAAEFQDSGWEEDREDVSPLECEIV